MTLACKANNTYATAPAPTTLDATIDKARKQFQIEAPGADLLYSRPYEILTEQVTGGKFIGREIIDGVATSHLAFEGEEVDWQIWIQEGSAALAAAVRDRQQDRQRPARVRGPAFQLGYAGGHRGFDVRIPAGGGGEARAGAGIMRTGSRGKGE